MTPHTVLDKYPHYQMDIGIEVHVQLNTLSKIFCPNTNGPTEIPNSTIDPINVGYPGTLPMLNKKVVDYAILTGLATNCSINQESEFARKHYFYPDLPKGYQISQDDKPICEHGYVMIKLEDGSAKKIRIRRIHMEEDAGKNIHADDADVSFVDLNRAGSPLLEIVTEPDIKNAYEARMYLKALHSIVTYLGVCSGDMEKGVFRADTNISVRPLNAQELGTRCELKNINSFKFISDAIEYEAERQITLLEGGERIIQQTRLWNTQTNKTVAMRSKEEAADYRYFPDPDLPRVLIDDAWITTMRAQLPELPQQKHERLKSEYGITDDEAEILINDVQAAHYFEEAQKIHSSPNLINWLLRNVLGYAKEHKIDLTTLKVRPEHLAQLVEMVDKGVINTRIAQEVFNLVAESGQNPEQIVKERGLEQMDNSAELEALILDLIKNNPQQAAAYKAGQTKLIGFFVGKIMAATQGRGNPKIIQDLLLKHLA